MPAFHSGVQAYASDNVKTETYPGVTGQSFQAG